MAEEEVLAVDLQPLCRRTPEKQNHAEAETTVLHVACSVRNEGAGGRSPRGSESSKRENEDNGVSRGVHLCSGTGT